MAPSSHVRLVVCLDDAGVLAAQQLQILVELVNGLLGQLAVAGPQVRAEGGQSLGHGVAGQGEQILGSDLEGACQRGQVVTLHQFAEALLVEQNPDKPDRPINSPNWSYRIHPRALEVIRLYGQAGFDEALREYLTQVPGLKAQYETARRMNRIPVTLPGGAAVTLSPGGQNILIKQMVEDFCAYFTPGAEVLYVGDADAKWAVFEQEILESLGVSVDQHGKMPDLVVYMRDRHWLVLFEAAYSHGPVDAKRHGELSRLFANSSAGLVYVSCFPDRREMRKYLADIAWETEVWCADNPTHLIHFNGERFLGPYHSTSGAG